MPYFFREAVARSDEGMKKVASENFIGEPGVPGLRHEKKNLKKGVSRGDRNRVERVILSGR